MSKMLIGTTALVLILAGQVRAEDPKDARAVVDKAIKAMGGAKKLEKFKAMTWKEKGTYYGMGDGVPYQGVLAVEWPDKFRMEIENVFTLVVNGDQGWMGTAGNVTAMNKEQMEEQKEERYAGWVTTLLPLKEKGFELSPLGESKIDSKTAVGVKVSHKGHRAVKLYFDKDSGLLVASQYHVKAEEQGGKDLNQEVTYGNYQEVDGIKVPMKITIQRDGKRFLESENYEVKPAVKLDAKLFAKP